MITRSFCTIIIIDDKNVNFISHHRPYSYYKHHPRVLDTLATTFQNFAYIADIIGITNIAVPFSKITRMPRSY